MPDLASLPLGLYEKALPPADWSVLLKRAGELGFQFVEMSIDESDERLARLDWTDSRRREFREAVAESGLTVPSICLSGNRRFPIGSGNTEAVRSGVDLIRRGVDLAVDLGVRVIQLAGYDVYYDEESTPETRERFARNLESVVHYAAGRGVTLSVEIMDTRFMSSISRFLYLKRRIPSPWFTVYPDLGNLSAWNDNAVEELELGLREGVISAVHLKDTYAVTPTSGGQFRDVPFGEGCVDFLRLFRILRRHEYAGPFLIEMWNRNGEADIPSVVQAKTWLVQLLQQADGEYDRS
jgi:L-ribulose-5-phosphate 3-epimerase